MAAAAARAPRAVPPVPPRGVAGDEIFFPLFLSPKQLATCYEQFRRGHISVVYIIRKMSDILVLRLCLKDSNKREKHKRIIFRDESNIYYNSICNARTKTTG
jgi:hypothetical protein